MQFTQLAEAASEHFNLYDNDDGDNPLIYPRARAASRSRTDQVATQAPISPAAVSSLLLELAPLQGLLWPALAQRTEALVTALRGGDGITQQQVNQLRSWAAGWQSLPVKIRDFYRAELPADSVCIALWLVLEEKQHLSGPLRGELERRWIDRYGAPSTVSFSLKRST